MKNIYVISLLILLTGGVNAQYNWEVGGGIGTMNYLGDIGGGLETSHDARAWLLDMQFDETQFSLTGFSKYRFNRWVRAGVYLTYGKIKGTDADNANLSRRGRNLSFKNDIVELAVRADVNLLTIYDVGKKGYYNPDFSLYLFLGVGGVYHNPKAEFNGTTYSLRPLTTEGVDYSNIAFVIPGGLGFFLTFNRVNRIGFEAQYSYTFTDYLDDVSDRYVDPATLPSDIARLLANRRPELGDEAGVPAPENYTAGNRRGDPNHPDGYMTIRFTYSYVLRGKSGYYKRGQYNFLHRSSKKRRKSRAKF